MGFRWRVGGYGDVSLAREWSTWRGERGVVTLFFFFFFLSRDTEQFVATTYGRGCLSGI